MDVDEEIPAWLLSAFPGHTWKTLRFCNLRVEDGTAGIDLEASQYGYSVDDVEDVPGQAPELTKGAIVLGIAGQSLVRLDEDSLEEMFGKHFGHGVRLTIADANEVAIASAGATVSAEPKADTVEVGGLVMKSLPPRERRRRRGPVAQVDEEVGDAMEECEGECVLPATPEVRQYEYRDHTADVILRSWGKTEVEAWEQVCVAFFSYMTELDKIEFKHTVEVSAEGHDLLDLLYHLLDEFLFSFGTEFVMCRRVEIVELDLKNLKARARGYGDKFDLAKHPQGTEIKAITMHQMKLLTPETLTTEEGVIPRKDSNMEGGGVKEGFPYECYVLVDI